jgi:hypothetical protein
LGLFVCWVGIKNGLFGLGFGFFLVWFSLWMLDFFLVFGWIGLFLWFLDAWICLVYSRVGPPGQTVLLVASMMM